MSEQQTNPESERQPTAFEALTARVEDILEGVEPRVSEWSKVFLEVIVLRKKPQFREETRTTDVRHRNRYEGVHISDVKKFESGTLVKRDTMLAGFEERPSGSWVMAHALWETNLSVDNLNEEQAGAILRCLNEELTIREAAETVLNDFKADRDL